MLEEIYHIGTRVKRKIDSRSKKAYTQADGYFDERFPPRAAHAGARAAVRRGPQGRFRVGPFHDGEKDYQGSLEAVAEAPLRHDHVSL
jgi:hypothetical protein